MSADGMTLVFASERAGGEGGFDIWMSERESVAADWGQATNLGAVVNTAGNERPSQLWEAENLLLFKSGGQGYPDCLVKAEQTCSMSTLFPSHRPQC